MLKTIFDFTVSQTLVGFGMELKNGSANRSVFKLSYGQRKVQTFVICASVYTSRKKAAWNREQAHTQRNAKVGR
mgnify:CR=1 FL=1